MTFYCSLFFDEDEDFKKTDTRENLSYFIIVHKKSLGLTLVTLVLNSFHMEGARFLLAKILWSFISDKGK